MSHLVNLDFPASDVDKVQLEQLRKKMRVSLYRYMSRPISMNDIESGAMRDVNRLLSTVPTAIGWYELAECIISLQYLEERAAETTVGGNRPLLSAEIEYIKHVRKAFMPKSWVLQKGQEAAEFIDSLDYGAPPSQWNDANAFRSRLHMDEWLTE